MAAGFTARPVLYGMKLANLLAGGKMRAIDLGLPASQVTAWAADLEGGTRIIVVNNAPSLTAISGVTLAGAEITATELWRPRNEERIASEAGMVEVRVKAASAAALFFDDRLAWRAYLLSCDEILLFNSDWSYSLLWALDGNCFFAICSLGSRSWWP